MASVRARRPRPQAEMPNKTRRRASAPPPISGKTPRIAAIQGAFAHGEKQPWDPRAAGMGAIGILLFGGAAIAIAAFAGGGLFDAREAFDRSSDSLAANVGFESSADDIHVTGVSEARVAEVRAAINPDGRHSILALDPGEVKARVEALEWVESARVRRLWPSRIEIAIKRRDALALWRTNQGTVVVDVHGNPLESERPEDNTNLPLLKGKGAGPAAEPILAALEDMPNVRSRLNALVRVGERRWDLELRNGAVAKLPENEAEMRAALHALEDQQMASRLLDRVASVDLRLRGFMAVRTEPDLAGASLESRGA